MGLLAAIWWKIWLLDDFEENWRYSGEKQLGSQFEYSVQAITIVLTIKNVFHLPNRATEGFMRSIFAMLKATLLVPDHTTLLRRGKGLEVTLPNKVNGHVDIVMDGTGLKIYSEGEWKVRTHGNHRVKMLTSGSTGTRMQNG